MAVRWDYYNRFDEVDNKYLPDYGEGETMATQIVTAVNKLVYKWYNDGDVYDNTYYMEGWWNDISSYANWLVKYTNRANCLYQINDIWSASDYEDLLKELADLTLDPAYLEEMDKKEKTGSIYKCEGPFRYEEPEDGEEW